ncbi:hypothetical protein [Kordia sp.]|uniref:hypothetical protein n=1 Tax=Kordia sp. TaxID=1965332 RepID=UPI003D29C50E
MKYPSIKTKFKDGCSAEDKEVILKYWELKDDSFEIKPSQLAKQLQINTHQLSKLVKTNSKSKLFTEICLVCEEKIVFEITSQTRATQLIEVLKYECSDCKSKFNAQTKGIYGREKKPYRLKYALEFEFWTRLKKEELEVLKKIIEYDDYFEFRKKYLNQNYDFAWTIVEKLDRLGLIDICGRNYVNERITEIFFLPELREALKIEPKENIFYETELSFFISKHVNKRKDTQPDFMKRVIFENDIVLKKDIEYFCSVWKNNDGTINLRIKEKSKIIKSQTDYEHPKNEPKPLKDLIPKKWKED